MSEDIVWLKRFVPPSSSPISVFERTCRFRNDTSALAWIQKVKSQHSTCQSLIHVLTFDIPFDNSDLQSYPACWYVSKLLALCQKIQLHGFISTSLHFVHSSFADSCVSLSFLMNHNKIIAAKLIFKILTTSWPSSIPDIVRNCWPCDTSLSVCFAALTGIHNFKLASAKPDWHKERQTLIEATLSQGTLYHGQSICIPMFHHKPQLDSNYKDNTSALLAQLSIAKFIHSANSTCALNCNLLVQCHEILKTPKHAAVYYEANVLKQLNLYICQYNSSKKTAIADTKVTYQSTSKLDSIAARLAHYTIPDPQCLYHHQNNNNELINEFDHMWKRCKT